MVSEKDYKDLLKEIDECKKDASKASDKISDFEREHKEMKRNDFFLRIFGSASLFLVCAGLIAIFFSIGDRVDAEVKAQIVKGADKKIEAAQKAAEASAKAATASEESAKSSAGSSEGYAYKSKTKYDEILSIIDNGELGKKLKEIQLKTLDHLAITIEPVVIYTCSNEAQRKQRIDEHAPKRGSRLYASWNETNKALQAETFFSSDGVRYKLDPKVGKIISVHLITTVQNLNIPESIFQNDGKQGVTQNYPGLEGYVTIYGSGINTDVIPAIMDAKLMIVYQKP
jgi:hypothetical protein